MPEEPQNDKNDRVSKFVRLLKEADAGKFERLECPKCEHLAVAVWFTHPAPDEYRIWFKCTDCDFHTRAQLAEKPHYFSESRINKELEGRDVAILQNAIFKKPPRK
jgi:hypothetical protein